MKTLRYIWLLTTALALLLASCSPLNTDEGSPGIEDGHGDHRAVIALSSDELKQRFKQGSAQFEIGKAFQQIGFMLTAKQTPRLDYRVQLADGTLTSWQDVEVTWSEAPLHNARILLEQPATKLELRGGELLSTMQLEFSEKAAANLGPLARDLPFETESLESQAGPSWIISRAQWGARQTKCTTNERPYHTPNKITVHHEGGNNNKIDPQRKMRQLQAYFMDSKPGGPFCDIGYHLYISYDGQVFRGWDEQRRGAHIGGQNTDNIGVLVIGNFLNEVPPAVQLEGTAKILGWLGKTYNIPLNRDKVKGHGERASTPCPGKVLGKLPEILRLANTPSKPIRFSSRTFVTINGTQVESISAYEKVWNFDVNKPWGGRNGDTLSSVKRYSAPGGPCAGRSSNCEFDTRTFINGKIESITVGNQIWDAVGSGYRKRPISGFNHYRFGPCQGRTSSCKFDTRTFVYLEGEWVESISAYGRAWNFVGTRAWKPDKQGRLLSGVPKYANGPCEGRSGSSCRFDTRTFAKIEGRLIESITIGNEYWNFSSAPNSPVSGKLSEVLPRYKDIMP